MDTKTYENIRKSLRQLIRSYGVFSDTKWNHFGISYAQSQVLFEISESPGITARDITAKLEVDKSTTSRLLKRLSSGDLITFKVDPHDCRLKAIHLTPAGARLVKKLNAYGNERSKQIFSKLSKREIKELDRVLAPFR